MAFEIVGFHETANEDVVGALLRRRRGESVDMDITPMIDIVFLLLIFFLVASIPDMQVEADLPPARHGVGVNPRSAIVFTLAERGGGQQAAKVYLSDGKSGQPIPADFAGQEAAIERALRGEAGVALPDDLTEQEAIIRRAVVAGFHQAGLANVLVKAEKGVLHRDVARVTRAIAEAGAEGIQLNLAVYEIR